MTSNIENTANIEGASVTEPFPAHSLAAQLQELIWRIERFAKTDGFTETPIKGLRLIRASQPSTATHTVYEPSLCLIAQGNKQAALGNEIYRYDPAHYLVAAVDIPVIGQVMNATPEKPYLCFNLIFSPQDIQELLLAGNKAGAPGFPTRLTPKRGLFVSAAKPPLLDVALRLLRLLDTPGDIPLLSPLLLREIIYRLLQDDQGDTLAQVALADSHAQQINRVINILKHNYHRNLRIEDLAREACMSSSSLHTHFKTITNMTPLQYQKHLRLQEARRLLFAEQLDAATASHRVGYESPSQFSREYNRLFGLSPLRDIARLRSSGAFTDLA